ncbi:acyltransferase [Nocardioides sp.]|uniref:acyltransferase family protein n=1 Tax=Nocardioides sp. TaxID=35761 RepID=UPI002732D6EE|nr:acyltransferase [Nocardioides sp.]MDP3894923.1 acyltransferase [Nocardioides sp.]
MAASSAVVPQEDPSERGRSLQKTLEIASLTGLRGFAAMIVVVVHVAGRTDFPWVGIHGYGPVSLFVLSGFLLYRPWARWLLGTAARPGLRSFFRRRVARIFPAYLLVLLTVAVVYPPSQPVGADGWLRAVTLTGIYASDGLRPGLEQAWSLGTELSWYVALPVVGLASFALLRRLSRRGAFWGAFLLLSLSVPVTAAWRWWVHIEDLGRHFTYSFWLPGFLAAFAAGALVALCIEGEHAGVVRLGRLHALAHGQRLLILAAVAVTLVGASSLGGPHAYAPATFSERNVRFVSVLVLATILLVAAAMGGPRSPVNRFLGTRGMVAVGRWSYGLYLWHLPVIVILAHDFVLPTGHVGLPLQLALVLVISLPLSAATYAWVERPAMAWSRGAGWRGSRRPEEGSVASPSRRPATTTD